jgi:hypothetical protein
LETVVPVLLQIARSAIVENELGIASAFVDKFLNGTTHALVSVNLAIHALVGGFYLEN